MNLKGKVAVVTGSSSGIGEAIARALAKENVVVIVNSRNNTSKGEKVASGIVKDGGKALYIKADISDTNETKELFEKVLKEYGQIDVLVNNAGEARGGEFNDIDLWKFQFENILLSQVIATSEFLKHQSDIIRKIINISSIYGSHLGGKENYLAYSAAKAGVNSMTVNLAKNLGGNVLVNAIAPGWTWTPAWGEDRKSEESFVVGKLPIDRFVESEEVAQMVIELLKNDAITGQIITIDGGASLKEFAL